jgi:hypothetical protein
MPCKDQSRQRLPRESGARLGALPIPRRAVDRAEDRGRPCRYRQGRKRTRWRAYRASRSANELAIFDPVEPPRPDSPEAARAFLVRALPPKPSSRAEIDSDSLNG